MDGKKRIYRKNANIYNMKPKVDIGDEKEKNTEEYFLENKEKDIPKVNLYYLIIVIKCCPGEIIYSQILSFD